MPVAERSDTSAGASEKRRLHSASSSKPGKNVEVIVHNSTNSGRVGSLHTAVTPHRVLCAGLVGTELSGAAIGPRR